MKKVKHAIVPLLLLLALAACQTGQVAGYFTALFDSASDLFSDWGQSMAGRDFESLKNRTQEAEDENWGVASGNICQVLTGMPEAITSVESNMQHVRDNLCECRAWGTCPVSICPCDKLCPNTFAIFDRRPYQGQRAQDLLPFGNTDEHFPNHTVSGGYCRGFAVVQQRFNRLAFFEPQEELPEDIRENPRARRRYFSSILKDIVANKPRKIPGFSSVYEFLSSTEYPEIRELAQEHVANQWRRLSMNFHAAGSAFGTGGMNLESRRSFVNDVKYRLRNNMQPSIDMTKQNGGVNDVHVVIVNDLRENEDGSVTLCISDSNQFLNSDQALDSSIPKSRSEECGNQMNIPMNEENEISYTLFNNINLPTTSNLSPVGKLKVSHHENRDSADQVRSLARFCRENKSCP